MPSFDGELVRRRQHVRDQATTPALPGPPVSAAHELVMPLELVMVDEDPYDADGALRAEWATLPPRFAAALADVGHAGIGRARCWLCAGPVGHIRTDPVTTGAIAVWSFVALVWSPSTPETPVNVMCEGCAPITLDAPVEPLPPYRHPSSAVLTALAAAVTTTTVTPERCLTTAERETHFYDGLTGSCRCGLRQRGGW